MNQEVWFLSEWLLCSSSFKWRICIHWSPVQELMTLMSWLLLVNFNYESVGEVSHCHVWWNVPLRLKRHILWVSELLKLSQYLATELHLSSKFFFLKFNGTVKEELGKLGNWKQNSLGLSSLSSSHFHSLRHPRISHNLCIKMKRSTNI